jgi:chromosome partitioning protein
MTNQQLTDVTPISEITTPTFTSKEFASLLNVSKSTVVKWEREGRLPEARRIQRGAIKSRFYTGCDASEARQNLNLPSILKKKGHVQLFFNMKGGTGKSTIAYNYAAFIASMGLRVLAIDLDGQSHLTLLLRMETHRESPSIMDILDPYAEPKFKDVVKPTWVPNLDILPSNNTLTTLELFLFKLVQEKRATYSANIIDNVLREHFSDYDVVVIDTGPNLGLVNVNALYMADDVIVPVKTDYLSVEAASYLFEQLVEIQSTLKVKFDKIHLLPNMYDQTKNICKRSMMAIQQNFSEYLGNTIINESAAITTATANSSPVFINDKRSKGAIDIVSFSREVLDIPVRPGDYWQRNGSYHYTSQVEVTPVVNTNESWGNQLRA